MKSAIIPKLLQYNSLTLQQNLIDLVGWMAFYSLFIRVCILQLLNLLEFILGPYCFIRVINSKLTGPGYEPNFPLRGHVLWLDQTVRVVHRGPEGALPD